MSLEAINVSVRRSSRTILHNVSLGVHAGELLVVVGPNGAGKSTLLAALAGDSDVSSGEICLDGRSLDDFGLDELASRRAVVGTPPRLAFDYTVRDVVAMGWLHGESLGGNARETALNAVLQANELADLAQRTYMTLSSGERQRAEYARASLQLWRDPREGNRKGDWQKSRAGISEGNNAETDEGLLEEKGVGIDEGTRRQQRDVVCVSSREARWLLLDEPTANLDVAHGITMLESLAAQARRGDGVLAVLHDLDLAARFADRVALLAGGELVALGTPEEVLTATRLSAVYRTPIHVEEHAQLERLVVIG